MLEDGRHQAVSGLGNLVVLALVPGAVLVTYLRHLAGRALDPPPARVEHVLAVGFEHGLDQRYPPARPYRPGPDRDLPDGDRPQDVHADPREPLPRIGIVQLKRPGRQRRGRAAVLGIGRPRADRCRGSDVGVLADWLVERVLHQADVTGG